VRKLQEQNIQPKNSKRGVWSTSTLSTMLRHKGYIGQAHWGSSYAVIPENPKNTNKYRQVKKSSRRTKPETEWIAPNIPIPAIISEKLFTEVQAQLKANFELCKRNTKNQYLIGGKIFCICGKKRCGEGPQHGKHLYYRCSDRVYSFPLPAACKEKGINARIADKLVWEEITKLMTSPDLLQTQLNRWTNERKDKTRFSMIDMEAIKKEITKLEAQVERYTHAYGEGVISLLKLREYTEPRNKQVEKLESQIKNAEQEERSANVSIPPTEDELKLFSEAVKETAQNLNFEKKQEIIRNVVVKIVGTQKELEISGNIPLTSLNHVKFISFNRHCRPSKRRQVHSF
jgi:site-specific DNA recombinase